MRSLLHYPIKKRHISALSWAVLATLICMAGSALYALLFFFADANASIAKAVAFSLVPPIFIGTPVYYLLVKKIRSLTFRARRLELKSRRDGMTKCLNKMAFHREVVQFLGTKTLARRRAALLIIDADHFKAINDTYGHDAGDRALKVIASKLRGVVRRTDIIGRIGGEEFGVLLHDADMLDASAVAERIRSSINLSDVPGAALGARLSVSVGGTVFEDEVSFAEIFKAADSRLYTAKAKGRNRVDIGPLLHERRANPMLEERRAA